MEKALLSMARGEVASSKEGAKEEDSRGRVVVSRDDRGGEDSSSSV
jgi:hypothetical protein